MSNADVSSFLCEKTSNPSSENDGVMTCRPFTFEDVPKMVLSEKDTGTGFDAKKLGQKGSSWKWSSVEGTKKEPADAGTVVSVEMTAPQWKEIKEIGTGFALTGALSLVDHQLQTESITNLVWAAGISSLLDAVRFSGETALTEASEGTISPAVARNFVRTLLTSFGVGSGLYFGSEQASIRSVYDYNEMRRRKYGFLAGGLIQGLRVLEGMFEEPRDGDWVPPTAEAPETPVSSRRKPKVQAGASSKE